MKYAVISGGTHGIGKAIAEKLLEQGFSLAICARNTHHLNATNAQWSAKYPTQRIICFTADVSIKTEVDAFAATVLSAFKRIDVLVNNAGVFTPGNLADETNGAMEALMASNVYSAYYLSRALLPAMKEQNSGHIFNICSVASLKAYPHGGSYGISKYALLGFNDNLREELKAFNIKVTAISPGATHSRSWEESGIDPDRLMDARDIAEMLFASYALSAKANVEHIIMRPIQGDI